MTAPLKRGAQYLFQLEEYKQIKNIMGVYIPFFTMNIPLNYNGELNKFAKYNRSQMNMPKAEGIMRNLVLKKKQMLGYKS